MEGGACLRGGLRGRQSLSTWGSEASVASRGSSAFVTCRRLGFGHGLLGLGMGLTGSAVTRHARSRARDAEGRGMCMALLVVGRLVQLICKWQRAAWYAVVLVLSSVDMIHIPIRLGGTNIFTSSGRQQQH